MKKSLVLGLGGSGSRVAELFFKTFTGNNEFVALGIDSDVEETERINLIPTICMTDFSSLGQVLDAVNPETVSEWFPCDISDNKVSYFKSLEMGRGANGWRMKGMLAFENLFSDEEKKKTFTSVLDALAFENNVEEGSLEVFLISSLCGGTGSALLLPVAFYLKRYLKEKYNQPVKINAIVGCPDIYTEYLNAEQRVKAYANSYATLRELNALNLVAHGYNQKAKESHSKEIKFKLGSKDSNGAGLLIDTSLAEFNNPDAQPFERVYLIDKIPGLRSVPDHESVISKAIEVIIDGGVEKKYDSPFAGLSLSEVVFPYERIVDYVAVKKTFDDLGNEWINLYSDSKRILNDNGEKETISSLSTALEKAYQKRYSSGFYYSELALSRVSEDDFFAKENNLSEDFNDELIENYIQSLNRSIQDILNNDCEQFLLAEFDAKNSTLTPISFWDSKNNKLKKISDFKTIIEKSCNKINEFQVRCVETFNESLKKLEEDILKEEGELSLSKHLLSKGGKKLHPVMEALALSVLYNRMNANKVSIPNEDKVLLTKSEDPLLHNSVLKKYSFHNNTSIPEYDALGSTRLFDLLLSTNEPVLRKLLTDTSAVKDDLFELYQKIYSTFFVAYFEAVKGSINLILHKYYSCFDSLNSLREDHKIDVRIALLNGTTCDLTRMDVGCSEVMKEKIYTEYCERNIFDEFDSISGEIVYQSIFENQDDSLDLFDKLVEKRKNIVRKNDFIKKIIGSNILRVLHDRDLTKKECDKRSAYDDLNQAFSLTATPLDIPEEKSEDYQQLVRESITLIPRTSAIFAKSILNEDCDDQIALEKYLMRQGTECSNLQLSDSIKSNTILSIKKVLNLPLCLFNKTNEPGDERAYYQSYLKSIRVMKEQGTQMWNPYLLKTIPRKNFLPYLSPCMQNEYEKGIYFSIIYILNKGILHVKPNNAKIPVYFYRDGEKDKEIIYEGRGIQQNDFPKLFAFAGDDPEFTLRYSKEFREDFLEECNKLPFKTFEFVNLPEIAKHILGGNIAKSLYGDMFSHLHSTQPLEETCMIDFIIDTIAEGTYKEEMYQLSNIIKDLLRESISFRAEEDEKMISDLTSLVKEGLKEKYLNLSNNLKREKEDSDFRIATALNLLFDND